MCCSREGFIIVANRSNDRVEVFTPKGIFHHKFGTSGNFRSSNFPSNEKAQKRDLFSPGKQNGQFDRPASVCCDKKNRIIVTDKDNHRVQVLY